MKFRTKVLASIIREHLYVDDGDIVSHSERCLEPHISELDSACDEFGWIINLKKNVEMIIGAGGIVCNHAWKFCLG